MNSPFLSVIVPVYGVEDYLETCVDSILDQPFADLELILVDDGSPDRCPQICDAYAAKDSRVRVIHKPNGGLSSARNAGLDMARGEYISFVDSDDYIRSGMYLSMMERCRALDLDLCLCGHAIARENTVTDADNFEDIPADQVFSSDDLLQKLVYSVNTNYVVVWNKIVRRAALGTLRFAEGKQHEDEYLMHRLYGACHRIGMVNEAFYVYRQRMDSIMAHGVSVKRLDAMGAYLDRMNFLLDRGQASLVAHVLNRATTMMGRLYTGLDAEGRGKLRTIQKEFWEMFREIPGMYFPVRSKIKIVLVLKVFPIYVAGIRLRASIGGQRKDVGRNSQV